MLNPHMGLDCQVVLQGLFSLKGQGLPSERTEEASHLSHLCDLSTHFNERRSNLITLARNSKHTTVNCPHSRNVTYKQTWVWLNAGGPLGWF